MYNPAPMNHLPSSAPLPVRSVALLLLIAALLGACVIGTRDLWAPDEPKYALVAREMIETGQWLRPHVNGRPYPDKPPLMFWCIALASTLTGGVGEPAAVIPSIVAMLLTLLAVARLSWLLGPLGADPSKNPRAARLGPPLAVGLLLISYRFLAEGTAGQIDMLLTACTSWAFLLLLEGSGILFVGESTDTAIPPGARNNGKLLLSFLAMGLGILAKGPVALICPLGGFAAGAWLAGRRSAIRAAFRPLPWAVALGVVALWLVPAAVGAITSGQTAWLENLLFKQTAVRYAASWHHHQPFWYFLLVPWYDFVPAILLLPGAAWRLIRPPAGTRRSFPALLLAGACLFVLVFFSIPSGKRGLYLMPMYPWLATWLALDLASRLTAGPERSAPASPRLRSLLDLRIVAGLLAALFLLAGGWAISALPRLAAKESVALPVTPLVAGLLAAGLAHALLALRPRKRGALLAAFAGWCLIHGLIFLVVNPAFDPIKSARPLIAAIRERTVPCAQGGMVDFRAQFGFYAGPMAQAQPGNDEEMDAIARRLAGEEPFWVLVRRHHVELLLSRIAKREQPVLLLEKRSGSNEMVVLANRSALRGSGWSCP